MGLRARVVAQGPRHGGRRDRAPTPTSWPSTSPRTARSSWAGACTAAGPGPWEDDPNAGGWWGDDPPFHVPVFVLTHHPRESREMQGGTTFHFVTDGIDAALDRAAEAAGDRAVHVAGGADVVQQALDAGRFDELTVHVAPVLLGSGTRLFEEVDAGRVKLEPLPMPASPAVTHLRYRVRR